MSGLLSVEEAIQRITNAVTTPVAAETIDINLASSRVLAEQLTATRTQPPFRASAMDGYAVRAVDLTPGKPLHLIGESAAGRGFHGAIGTDETVRIFTGAPVPEGADTILIQENARVEGQTIVPTQTETIGRFVRPEGADFKTGDTFFAAGYRLRPKDMALAASLGPGHILVRRRPRIAVLATGDELVNPGEAPGLDQIIAANHLSVMGLANKAGAEARFLGIAADNLDALADSIQAAIDWKADVLVTMGGASVGDHDLVQNALAAAGMDLAFWRIAMRPGKPLMSGSLGTMQVLGLPGNPASSVVCAHVFLKPLIAALSGENIKACTTPMPAKLGCDLDPNDQRQEYMRATLARDAHGTAIVTPLKQQDSSLTRVLAEADVLVIRAPHASAAKAGDSCFYLPVE
ncbi:MAG: molybdopterin molybdotransferase MoeA [Beijerinckiaceae bacterium]